ncbi:ABC transporter permease subunit, partial [Burkholderia pseudomallei]
YTDGYRFSGLGISLWLLVVSIGIGFCLSVPLAVALVSKKKWLAGAVWLYTYVFRGTPLYVQLLLCYTGLYSLQAERGTPMLDAFFR